MKKFYLVLLMMYASSLFSQTVPPYTQDFTTFPLTGWTFGYAYSESVATGPTSTSSFYWLQKPFLNNTVENNQSLRVNLYTSQISHWAITNTFDLSGGNYEISFDCGTAKDPYQTNPSGPAPQIEAGDNFKVMISTNGGTSWEELKVWSNPNINIPNQRTAYKIDVSAYHSSSVKFAFYAWDGAVYNGLASYCIFVDNFKVMTKEIMATAESGKSLFNIYPNPTKNKAYIISDKKIKLAELFDISGKLLKTSAEKEIDLSKYKAGVYTLKTVFSDNSVISKNIIKN